MIENKKTMQSPSVATCRCGQEMHYIIKTQNLYQYSRANLRLQDADDHRHPIQNHNHPPTETATNFKNWNHFPSNCSETSNGRQPIAIPHLDLRHPSATFRRSHTPVPASPKSVSCADEIGVLRLASLPEMIVPPHDIKEKNSAVTLANWDP